MIFTNNGLGKLEEYVDLFLDLAEGVSLYLSLAWYLYIIFRPSHASVMGIGDGWPHNNELRVVFVPLVIFPFIWACFFDI